MINVIIFHLFGIIVFLYFFFFFVLNLPVIYWPKSCPLVSCDNLKRK